MPEFFVVAVLDIGTQYSGLAYSFSYEPTSVFSIQCEDSSASLERVATTLLVDDTGQFHSFGLRAENHFASLEEENKHSGWRLFRHFKMQLHNKKNLSEQTTIKDHEGKHYSAIDVFSMAYKHLRCKLLDTICVKDTDIQYVIPVQATLDLSVKQFIRMAAIKAGIDRNRLDIPFEDQTIAKWCTRNNGPAPSLNSEGSKYIVVDLGDTSSDIIVHRRMTNGNVEVEDKASFEKMSGIFIRQKFFQHLENVFGKDALLNFCKNEREDCYEMITSFELKMRTFAGHSKNEITIYCPSTLLTFGNAVTLNGLSGHRLRIEYSEVISWLEQITQPLLEHIQTLQDRSKDARTIFLAGALATTAYIQNRLKDELPGMTLIVPEEPMFAVLRGAVLYGHELDRSTRNSTFLVSTAFDLGSTNSGYAYSYTHDKTNVIINQTWSSGSSLYPIATNKAPSSVLLDDKGQFHSFGFEAENNFAALAKEHRNRGWRLFRHFKMHNTKFSGKMSTVDDTLGQPYSAKTIFSMAIRYLHGHLLDSLELKAPDIHAAHIQYVLTVPTTLDSKARELLKEAAADAGITSNRLTIAFEDQASTKWCVRDGGPAPDLNTKGSKYIIIDIGGGTADITVHEREDNATIKVTHRHSVSEWSGINVNQMFRQYLDNIFGKDALDDLYRNDIGFFLEITGMFEAQKRSSVTLSKYELQLPCSLLKTADKLKLNSLTESGKLNIPCSEVNSWFEKTVIPLIDYIKEHSQHEGMKGANTILLVGALAESKYIQDKISEELPGINLIVPEDAGLAIMRGAVLYGHDPCPDRVDEAILVSTAFDLGSTYSGYAYSYTHDKTNVIINQTWSSGSSLYPLVTNKAPSSVLLDDKGKFHSFGFEAEIHFAALDKENKNSGWRLFRHFKINNTKYSARISTVEDTLGQPYAARKIFSMAIQYLHGHLLKALKIKSPDIHSSNIRYVITVPTIWDAEARETLREAAKEAGIESKRLEIAFEDEASAKWCIRDGGPASDLNTTGSKYIIIDIGGGTADITVHQRDDNAKIKVIHKKSMPEWNGIYVNQMFMRHLETIFGKDALQDLHRNDIGYFLEITGLFEAQKRSSVILSQYELQLPFPLFNTAKKLKNIDESGKLTIPCSEVNSWYGNIAKPLIDYIKEHLCHEHIKGANTILLVGGLAESIYIQDKLRKELPEIRLIVPEDAGLVIMKGAVLYGHNPDRSNATSIMVAAFDFGTTYSGYAYSFKHEPNKVYTNQNWYSGGSSSSLVTLKTPTCVLLDDKGKFHAFGFEAENKFAALAEQGKSKGWRLFRRFKMQLYNVKNLSRNLTIDDIEGKPYPAMDIISMALRYLHEHLMSLLTLRVGSILETDLQYSITVPAIWDVAAKQFMREAAIKAGIDNKRVKLALESEVAAIWCCGLGIQRQSPGSKYIVIDLGGGTADITVYLRLSDNEVRVIHKSTGGAWGGIYVDKCYLAYLDRELGIGVLDELRKEHIDDYFDLIREFETKKRSRTIFDDGCIVKLPLSILEIVSKKKRKPRDTLKQKLHINPREVTAWFEQPISSLITHVKELRNHAQLEDIKEIVLVGGFAESEYVQNRLRNELSGLTLIVPEEAGLAVVKGAVLYGHDPRIVSSRVMSHTYGICLYNEFDETKHPLEKRILVNGNWKVKNCFEVFVRVNEAIAVGHEVSHTTTPVFDSSKSQFLVYRTLSKEPKYTTDHGCELMGTVTIKNIHNVQLDDQEKIVTFMFGHSELLVNVKHSLTGEVETLILDCLQ